MKDKAGLAPSFGQVFGVVKWFFSSYTRVLAGVLVAFTSIFLLIGYENRRDIYTIAVRELFFRQARLNEKVFEREAKLLIDRTGASSVVITSLENMLSKTTVFVYTKNGGVVKDFEGVTEELFPTDGKRGETDELRYFKQIKNVVAGGMVCDKHVPDSATGEYLEATGVTWGCAISIPPKARSLIGALTVGFTQEQKKTYFLESSMHNMANRILLD